MNQLVNSMVYYETYGNGFPLVILHGLGTDHRAMKSWIEPLFENRSGWQRFYIDLPAHGHSKVEEWVKTSDDILQIFLTFLDSIFPNQHFALAGKSFGGYMAQGIFNKRAKQIDGLCLDGTSDGSESVSLLAGGTAGPCLGQPGFSCF